MPRILLDEIVMPEELPDPTRLWLIAGIVATVVLIAAVICVILIKRKNKKKADA